MVLVGLIVAMFATMAFSQLAVGNFNAATGFSGKNGFTCTSCHNVPDLGPAGGEIYPEPATVTLDGLPEAWDLGQTYELTVTVTGGPPALPAPAPQGGFEIETDQGVFTPIDATAHLIDVYHPDRLAVTYTVEGTLVREWTLEWTAPVLPQPENIDTEAWSFGLDQLDEAPAPAGFWVAAMAANGNHVVALGMGDGGELGDSVDAIHVSVPPSQAALDGWAEVRLSPPVLVEQDAPIEVRAGEPFTLRFKQTDPRATHAQYRVNDGDWNLIQTAQFWDLAFSKGLVPGDHVLDIYSASVDLVSEPISVHINALEDEEVVTPTPFLALVVALLATRRWMA